MFLHILDRKCKKDYHKSLQKLSETSPSSLRMLGLGAVPSENVDFQRLRDVILDDDINIMISYHIMMSYHHHHQYW